MRFKISLLLGCLAVSAASSIALQWLASGFGSGALPAVESVGGPEAHVTDVARAAPEQIEEQAEELARIAFVDPDALQLKRGTFDDQPASAPDDTWTEATVIDAEQDPAPEATPGWQNGMRVERSEGAAAGTQPRDARVAELPPVTVAQTHKTALHAGTGRSAGAERDNGRERSVSLSQRLTEIAPGASARLAGKFQAAGLAWPPAEAALVAVKDSRTLELHARSQGGAWTFVHRYQVLAASGTAGPKLRKGDRQVPEGIYRISFLNPNSKYHVSLRVNYPNEFDRQMAAKDGRKDLGGDIMIHGKAASSGCLAVGDAAAEELFVLSERIGLAQVKLVIAPVDFRREAVPTPKPGDPPWLAGLYAQVASEMSAYKAPVASGGVVSGLLSFFGK